jgi:hypothetical protein
MDARSQSGPHAARGRRAGIVQAGADFRRQLKALIVTVPEPLRDNLRELRQLVTAMAPALLTSPGSALSLCPAADQLVASWP